MGHLHAASRVRWQPAPRLLQHPVHIMEELSRFASSQQHLSARQGSEAFPASSQPSARAAKISAAETSIVAAKIENLSMQKAFPSQIAYAAP